MQTPPAFAWHTPVPFQPTMPQSRKIASQLDSHADLGVPIGGIGAGGINRGPGGGFNRFTLKAGQVDYLTNPADGFALWTTQCTAHALRPTAPEGWPCDSTGHYAALFPAAWHSYRRGDLSLKIHQFSPVAPGLEPDTDLPCGLFRATFTNTGAAALDAALMLSFTNMVGWFNGFGAPGHPGGIAGQWNRATDNGVLMGRTVATIGEGDGQMMIAAQGGEVTTCPAFDPTRDGTALWADFASNGRINPLGDSWTSGGGFSEFHAPQHTGAVAAKVTLAPGASQTVTFVLVWDLPLIRFGQGRTWARHYTARWGTTGDNAELIATHALTSADRWADTIAKFHGDANSRLDLPPEATALAINELYMLTDGLSVWTAPTTTEPAHFGLIECPDYPLYNTLDLWVYAAATVADLFPELALLVACDYATTVAQADAEPRYHLRSTTRFPRQRHGMLPHDLGAPNADPFVCPNDYAYQDSTRWKDLNAMFAITAWRAARTSDPAPFVAPVMLAMEALAKFDRDGDGLIENDGFPDQTFDNIPLNGISAYCGGLWLAALRASAALCVSAGVDASRWIAMSKSAEPAFINALWTGEMLRVDSKGAFRDACFAEQMFGPATARMLGLGDVIDPDMARTALRTVFRRCFVETGGKGAVGVASATHSSSQYAPKGEEGLQWDEILIGFNYSLATQLRVYGLEAECRALMQALAHELGPVRGLHFRTPAAIVPSKPTFRAQMNLRPLGSLGLVASHA